MKNKLILLSLILLPLLVGSLSAAFMGNNIQTWYATLQKPSFNPPNYLFGPVWSILYLLMGISLILIYKSPISKNRNNALRMFIIQLGLNFFWSILFFTFHMILGAFIEIILLCIAIILMIFASYKVNKTSAYLQVPYLLWVTFATVLNASILLLN